MLLDCPVAFNYLSPRQLPSDIFSNLCVVTSFFSQPPVLVTIALVNCTTYKCIEYDSHQNRPKVYLPRPVNNGHPSLLFKWKSGWHIAFCVIHSAANRKCATRLLISDVFLVVGNKVNVYWTFRFRPSVNIANIWRRRPNQSSTHSTKSPKIEQ